jgi:TPR repeat protein
MSELNETGSSSRRNPLIWVSVAVIGLILFVLLSGDRGDSKPGGTDQAVSTGEDPGADEIAGTDKAVGTIERARPAPPGMRARQYVELIRSEGKPYPLELVYAKAQNFQQEGSLADAHLLFFFAAREEHLPAMMVMGEMSDPTRFRAEDSLLDNADVIQAYKWYQKAAERGYQPASERVTGLRQWAIDEAEAGNSYARQLLLNFK